MPIPRTREELVTLVEDAYRKLRDELDEAGPEVAELPCVDDWSVKDLLAVRAWWTESVVEWIERGRRGDELSLPAEGYGWNETPRLNDEIAERNRSAPYEELRGRLQRGFERTMDTIRELDDRELLETGVFEWAGKWPLSRWISVNTARQYTTARTHVRKALRDAAQGGDT